MPTSKPYVRLSRSLVLSNAIILKYLNVGTKFEAFSDNVFSIESALRRCGNVGAQPFKSADDSIKRTIDTFAGFVKNEMAALTLQLPGSTQNEITLQRLLVVPAFNSGLACDFFRLLRRPQSMLGSRRYNRH